MSLAAKVAVWLVSSSVIAVAAPTFERVVRPVFAKYCIGCHNDKAKTGGLSLQSTGAADEVVLEKVSERLRAKTMPPAPLRVPEQSLAAAQAWIDGRLASLEKQRKPVAGRVTARRLNRAEYNNTVRDLLGLTISPADQFPSDDSGYGFDNNGDVLTVSPVLMEKYLAAAEKIATTAIVVRRQFTASTQVYRKESGRFISQLDARHSAIADAEYQINVFAAVTPKGGPKPQMPLALILDGTTVHTFTVDTTPNRNRVFTTRIPMTAGEHTLTAVLVDEVKKPDQDSTTRTRASIDGLEVQGPYNAKPAAPSESHKRIFVCGVTPQDQTPECARKILANLQRRAFRRPVTEAEITRYYRLFEAAKAEGDSFEAAIQHALQAVLVAPQFLYRIESDSGKRSGGERSLTAFELASRLSYFLWSSMPDEELFRLAETGSLLKPAVLEAQVRRMLQDSKIGAFVENFAGQWLQVRNLEKHKPDPERFPTFDDKLRDAMQQETFLFIHSMIKEDRSILDLLDGKYTFLNERLARHYGIANVTGEHFRYVPLTDGRRSGVLTHASVLTVTSYEGRTSPVSRGKWLLQNILGAPPPPPPPDIPALEEKRSDATLSTRQQMEQHRANPACASCHVRMDPLGFSLENFDAIGAWRTSEGKAPIDASGILPDGRRFTGPAELKSILLQDRNAFAACFAEKLLTYGLGRGVERADRPVLKDITRKLAAREYRFSTLVSEVVKSVPFRRKQVESGEMRSSL